MTSCFLRSGMILGLSFFGLVVEYVHDKPLTLGTAAEPRPRDGPEFGQRGRRRPRPLWSNPDRGPGQDDLI